MSIFRIDCEALSSSPHPIQMQSETLKSRMAFGEVPHPVLALHLDPAFLSVP